MTPIGARVQVTDSPTALTVDESGRPVPGGSILVTNVSLSALDLGGEDVATGEGYELAPGDSLATDLQQSEILYAVAPDAGPYEVHVLRSGVVS